MSELICLENEMDALQRAMDAAYDLGDMEEWRRLRAELNKIGQQYRALLKELRRNDAA